MNTVEVLDAIDPAWRISALGAERLDALAATLVTDAMRTGQSIDLSEVEQLLRDSASREADNLCRWHLTLCELAEVTAVPEADRQKLIVLLERIFPKIEWSDAARTRNGKRLVRHDGVVAGILHKHLMEQA